MQWFVKMQPLATGAIGARQVRPDPHRAGALHQDLLDWLENIRDWCISRQLWWGHRIPVWYCAELRRDRPSAREDPTACAHCGSAKIEQDPDVLDTWFSSGLWPFSTLGWPDDTPTCARTIPPA